MSKENIWPLKEDLTKTKGVELAPFGVLQEYSDLLFNAYDKEIIGIILAKYRKKTNGDKMDFTYSLVFSQVKDAKIQLKIFEIDINDDGWYPAEVYLTKPWREFIGKAENECQFRTFLEQGIKSDFVRTQLAVLLKK